MSLIKAKELFKDSAVPVVVDTAVERTMFQKDMHRHEYFEMLFVEHGTLTNRFKNSDIRLKTGDVLILKPYVLHVLLGDQKQLKCKTYICSFLPQAVDSSIQSLEGINSHRSPYRYFFKSLLALSEEGISAIQLKIDPDRRSQLIELFSRLKDSTHDSSERGFAMTRCNFQMLLTVLAEQHEMKQGKVETVKIEQSVTVSRYKGGLGKTLSYIHGHFQEPLSLENMATMSGASSTYFCRLFKHETGMTFLNYVHSLRIERACVLLRDTSDSALEICHKVGFNDYAHFGRLLRKLTGYSPGEVRKQDTFIRRIREA